MRAPGHHRPEGWAVFLTLGGLFHLVSFGGTGVPKSYSMRQRGGGLFSLLERTAAGTVGSHLPSPGLCPPLCTHKSELLMASLQ